jgi:hypothetical protein
MFILFDQSVPAPLRDSLKGHGVVEAFERGWERLVNDDLLNAAEAEGFDVFITADKNIQFQQNRSSGKIAIIVLGNAQWPVLRRCVDWVVATVNKTKPGSFSDIEIRVADRAIPAPPSP